MEIFDNLESNFKFGEVAEVFHPSVCCIYHVCQAYVEKEKGLVWIQFYKDLSI